MPSSLAELTLLFRIRRFILHKSFYLLRIGQTETALKSGGTMAGVPVATGLVWAVAAFAFSVWHGLVSLC